MEIKGIVRELIGIGIWPHYAEDPKLFDAAMKEADRLARIIEINATDKAELDKVARANAVLAMACLDGTSTSWLDDQVWPNVRKLADIDWQ